MKKFSNYVSVLVTANSLRVSLYGAYALLSTAIHCLIKKFNYDLRVFTHGALVRLLPGMYPHMYVEAALVPRSVAAIVALVPRRIDVLRRALPALCPAPQHVDHFRPLFSLRRFAPVLFQHMRLHHLHGRVHKIAVLALVADDVSRVVAVVDVVRRLLRPERRWMRLRAGDERGERVTLSNVFLQMRQTNSFCSTGTALGAGRFSAMRRKRRPQCRQLYCSSPSWSVMCLCICSWVSARNPHTHWYLNSIEISQFEN